MKNDCNVDTKKMYSKVEDFLKDDDFIKYVLDDAPESAFHWDKLLKEHAELLKVFEEAKNVLLVSDEAMEVMTLSRNQTNTCCVRIISCIMYAGCFFVCKCGW